MGGVHPLAPRLDRHLGISRKITKTANPYVFSICFRLSPQTNMLPRKENIEVCETLDVFHMFPRKHSDHQNAVAPSPEGAFDAGPTRRNAVTRRRARRGANSQERLHQKAQERLHLAKSSKLQTPLCFPLIWQCFTFRFVRFAFNRITHICFRKTNGNNQTSMVCAFPLFA